MINIELILPVHPVTRHESNMLRSTVLRDDIENYVVNLEGSYGAPVIHARSANRHLVYWDACPQLRRHAVEQLLRNEQLSRPRGLSAVQFCEVCCTTELVEAAA